MSMGTRETDQPPLWIAASDLPASPGHPFYAQLNTVSFAKTWSVFAVAESVLLKDADGRVGVSSSHRVCRGATSR